MMVLWFCIWVFVVVVLLLLLLLFFRSVLIWSMYGWNALMSGIHFKIIYPGVVGNWGVQIKQEWPWAHNCWSWPTGQSRFVLLFYLDRCLKCPKWSLQNDLYCLFAQKYFSLPWCQRAQFAAINLIHNTINALTDKACNEENM